MPPKCPNEAKNGIICRLAQIHRPAYSFVEASRLAPPLTLKQRCKHSYQERVTTRLNADERRYLHFVASTSTRMQPNQAYGWKAAHIASGKYNLEPSPPKTPYKRTYAARRTIYQPIDEMRLERPKCGKPSTIRHEASILLRLEPPGCTSQLPSRNI